MDVQINESDAHHTEHHQQNENRNSRHHHRSDRNSGHRKHTNRSRKKKKKLSWEKIIIIALSALLTAMLVMILIGVNSGRISVPGNMAGQTENVAQDIFSVQLINSDGMLVNSAVEQYLLIDFENPYNHHIRLSDFSDDESRWDVQIPVGLEITAEGIFDTVYKIELADNEWFNNASVDYAARAELIYEFEHLYANTQYFYRVTAYSNKGVASQAGSFVTSDTPRILSIDGLRNVRDIGNWKTDSGKRVRQGLLLRGTEMDGDVEAAYHLTKDGLMDMLDVFGIKTDIDLRADTSTSMDALGSRVSHRYYDMVMYQGVFTDEGKEKVRLVFADFANYQNYPIYLHCTYGCDRTGTICYLLEALLGVSPGDCLKDYGLSNLDLANIRTVEEGLKAYEGDTLKEQAESYLLSCGVTEQQIESIRNIFLGD